MKIHLTLDVVAGSVLAFTTFLVGVIILVGTLTGVRVKVDLPKDQLVSSFQPILFTFSEPVDLEKASSAIFMEPKPEGYMVQLDIHSLQFVPVQPYERDTVYKLTISPGIVAQNGRAVKKVYEWEFMARIPSVAFLSPDATDSSIWVMDLMGDPPRRLTREGISVIAFDAAPNGNFLVYTVIDFSQAGMDLWKVSREGMDDEMLLDCGPDRCARSAISPNSRYIAYTRESPGKRKDRPFGSPHIWVFDLQTGQNNLVFEDQQILGFNLYWSPDSHKIASFDGLAGQIRIIDLKQNKLYSFPSNTDDPIAWSPDSNRILFTHLVQTDRGIVTQVNMADISSGKVQTLIGDKDKFDYSYSSLIWSLHEDRALLSLRIGEGHSEQVFWLFNPTTLEGSIIANQNDYTYSLPQWNPWSNALVFQQEKILGPFNPEVGLWQLGFDKPHVLTQGLMPQWLP